MDENCRESSAAFLAGAPWQDVFYSMSKMQEGDMANDSISSVKVPFGAYLTLYTEDGFIGNPFVVDGSANNMLGKEPECVNL